MLPIPVTWAAIGVATALAVGAGSGFYAGSEWESGKIAKQQVTTLTDTIANANTAIERLKKQTEEEAANRKKLIAPR